MVLPKPLIKEKPQQNQKTPIKREKVVVRCVVVNQPNHPIVSIIEDQDNQEFWNAVMAVTGVVVSHPPLLFTISITVSLSSLCE